MFGITWIQPDNVEQWNNKRMGTMKLWAYWNLQPIGNRIYWWAQELFTGLFLMAGVSDKYDYLIFDGTIVETISCDS